MRDLAVIAAVTYLILLPVAVGLLAQEVRRLRFDVLANDDDAHLRMTVINGNALDAGLAAEKLAARVSAGHTELAERIDTEASRRLDSQRLIGLRIDGLENRLLNDTTAARLKNAEDSLAAIHARLSLLGNARETFPAALRSDRVESYEAATPVTSDALITPEEFRDAWSERFPRNDLIEGYNPGPVS